VAPAIARARERREQRQRPTASALPPARDDDAGCRIVRRRDIAHAQREAHNDGYYDTANTTPVCPLPGGLFAVACEVPTKWAENEDPSARPGAIEIYSTEQEGLPLVRTLGCWPRNHHSTTRLADASNLSMVCLPGGLLATIEAWMALDSGNRPDVEVRKRSF
jgi:hypothetical protein